MTHGRLAFGLVVWVLFAAWGPATAGCGRPLGTVIDGEQPDAAVPADAALPPPPPCLDLADLDEAAPWPTFRRCQSRAGCSPNLGPASATVAWSEPIDTDLLGVAIGSDGRIYGPSTDPERASARDPDTGEELVWFQCWGSCVFQGFPTLGPGGVVWLQSKHDLVIFDPGGVEYGEVGVSQNAGAPLVRGRYFSMVDKGTIHLGDARFNTIDLLDLLRMDSPSQLPLAVSKASSLPSLVAANALIVGKRRTEFAGPWVWILIAIAGETLTEPFSSADALHDIVVGDGAGRTYLVADDASGTTSRLIGLDPSFATVTEVGGLAPLGIAPTLGPDNAVHVVAGGEDPPYTLRCLERDGAIRWEAPLPGLPLAHPLVDGDGTVYVGGEGFVIALDAQGATRWSLEETDEERSVQSLALGADRRLIVQTLTRLLAIGP